jgi:prepilin-type N-terminal cleavage/methylation domain-containing protein
MSSKLLKKQGGFTLLELLIVIVIIGILALLIIPNITSAPKKARDTKRKTDITTVRKGLEEYFVNNNVYPAALSDLTTGSAPIIQHQHDLHADRLSRKRPGQRCQRRSPRLALHHQDLPGSERQLVPALNIKATAD